MIGSMIRKTFTKFLLLVSLAVTIFLGLGIGNTPKAVAAIRQLEEAPGQMVYQSRQTLKDQHGNSWQAIAFKRIPLKGKPSFELRLVGFPGGVEIDRSKPLLLTNSVGKKLTAADNSSTIFTDLSTPEPNIGEYDLQPLRSQLQTKNPISLTIPTIGGEAINLSVPTSFAQEWQTLFSTRE